VARRAPARALLLLGVVLVVLLPTALHRTYYGGGSRDTRYLLAVVPALYAPLALWLDVIALSRRFLVRVALLGAAALLALWGLVRSYLSLLTMFGHRAVERSPEEAWRIVTGQWRDPTVVVPGLPFLPYFVTFAVPLCGLLWLVWLGWRWRTTRREEAF
jgi:hypothetical protein